MYNEHFGLEQAPFRITPDTRLFYSGGGRGGVLDALVYAITSGEGIIKVVGEVGSGKTMLCRMLEERLPEQVEIVYLANPSLTPDDILQAIALEMNLEVPSGANRLQVMHALQQRLVEKHAQNRQVVIFVEEAQSMPIETLEEIRLLSNLETKREKLLQIVLFGQPELDENLDQANIRQLRERITHSFYLEPFSRDELREYINFRMRTVGYRGPDVFHSSAYNSLTRASEGLTRRINILADKALLAAFAEDRHDVNRKHVRKAIVDSQFERRRPSRAPEFTLALGVVMVIGAVAWTFLGPKSQTTTDLATYQATETPPPAPAQTAAAETLMVATSAAPEEAGAKQVASNEVPEETSVVNPESGSISETSSPEPIASTVTTPLSAETTEAAAEVMRVSASVETEPADESRTTAPPSVAEAGPEPGPMAALPSTAEKSPVSSPSESAVSEMTVTPPEAPEPAVESTATVAAASQSTESVEAVGDGSSTAAEALLDRRIEITRSWLRETNEAHYSIQLLLTSRNQRRHLEDFLQRQSRTNGLEGVYVYETVINDRPYIGVLYGAFPTLTAARQALENLPASLKRLGPFIRNVSDISTVG